MQVWLCSVKQSCCQQEASLARSCCGWSLLHIWWYKTALFSIVTLFFYVASAGTYLLSGGEEAVLVLWQLDKDVKNFLPRLGSPIAKLTCSPNDSLFGVSLQNNGWCEICMSTANEEWYFLQLFVSSLGSIIVLSVQLVHSGRLFPSSMRRMVSLSGLD